MVVVRLVIVLSRSFDVVVDFVDVFEDVVAVAVAASAAIVADVVVVAMIDKYYL